MPDIDDLTIARVLGHRSWAMVGLTEHPTRTAYHIAQFLRGHGTRVVPVNLTGHPVLGEPGYRSLADLPDVPEVVAVYRRASAAAPYVQEAVRLGARAVWLPLDVVVTDAAEQAVAAGLDVVMDRCPLIEWPKVERLRAGSG
jgi:predicted CoA-binding protein